jgi:hypothetical protein
LVLSLPQFQNQPQPRRDPNFNRDPKFNNRDGRDYSHVAIVRSENENEGTGNYKWGFATDDQYTHQATGRLRKAFPNAEQETIGVEGSWSYRDPNGKLVTVHYTGKILRN